MVLPLSSTFSEQVMWSSTSLRKMMLLSILLSRSQPIVSKSLSHHPVTHFHTVTPDILSDSPMTIPCFLWLTATLSFTGGFFSSGKHAISPLVDPHGTYALSNCTFHIAYKISTSVPGTPTKT